jgi:hypothetical protein
MTVINHIEIDDIVYNRNEIKDAIINNDPIEDKLHVIVVVSNPCLYAIRYILMKEFLLRMELEETDVIIYIVELAYGNQKFIITQPNNKRHLQLRCDTPLWHKENMINIGVNKLLPSNWKAFAWIDVDIEFENPTWAKDTLKILNGSKDMVQLFSHCVDMNRQKEAMNVFTSFGFQYVKKNPYKKGLNFWHPGFAWAITRKAYERIGGLYEKAILGSGDNIMALSLIENGMKSINDLSTDGYKKSVEDYEYQMKKLRLGYVPGVIRHHYHGAKKNRKYAERWEILVKYNFDPYIHIKNNNTGLLIPTDECPREMLNEILNYFKERNEDEDFEDLRVH